MAFVKGWHWKALRFDSREYHFVIHVEYCRMTGLRMQTCHFLRDFLAVCILISIRH